MNDGERTVENKKIIGNFAASTFQLRKAGMLARKRVRIEVNCIIMGRGNLILIKRGHFIILIAAILICACGRLFGVLDLGDGFYVLEGDGPEDRIIVYNDQDKMAASIASGKTMVPSYDYWRSDSIECPYVRDVKYNSRWVLATVEHKDTLTYWILDKEKSLQECVAGPLTKKEYHRLLHYSEIDEDSGFHIIRTHIVGTIR